MKACWCCGTKVGSDVHGAGREAYGTVSEPSVQVAGLNGEGFRSIKHEAYACPRSARAVAD